MVTFKLKEENDRQLVYWYFPHGNEENGHGTIVIDRVLGKLDVTELAPDDRLVRHTVENQNRWRKAVNQMRNIEQIPEFFFTECLGSGFRSRRHGRLRQRVGSLLRMRAEHAGQQDQE